MFFVFSDGDSSSLYPTATCSSTVAALTIHLCIQLRLFHQELRHKLYPTATFSSIVATSRPPMNIGSSVTLEASFQRICTPVFGILKTFGIEILFAPSESALLLSKRTLIVSTDMHFLILRSGTLCTQEINVVPPTIEPMTDLKSGF